jgi:Flp pilus assembly protein TadG
MQVRFGWPAFRRDTRGGTTLVFALLLPALAMVASAVVEYTALSYRRLQLQSAVDSGSMSGASLLKLANADGTNVESITRATVQKAIAKSDNRQATITIALDAKNATVDVTVEEAVPSLMGQMLTLPSRSVRVHAQAQLVGSTRLCLLTLDPAARGALHLEKSAQLSAPDCSIIVNSKDTAAIQGENKASVSAQGICTAGGYSGAKSNFSPLPQKDCPPFEDPLKDAPAPFVSNTCASVPSFAGPGKGKGPGGPAAGANAVDATVTLDPGTYCGGLHISGSASVVLRAGVYVIKDGPLVVDGKASVSGQNVGFYFVGDAAGLRFDKDTTISLTAPREGAMAGLLMAETPSVSAPVPPPPGPKGPAPTPPGGATKPLREYRIISNNARTMLGTIYLPAGRLIIDSDKAVADQSAYTVIVAQQLDLYDGPNLVLNANYATTDVPVPKRVGPIFGKPALSH